MDEAAEIIYSSVVLAVEDFPNAAVILATRGQENFNEVQKCKSLQAKGRFVNIRCK